MTIERVLLAFIFILLWSVLMFGPILMGGGKK
jgi:hypothetical protein